MNKVRTSVTEMYIDDDGILRIKLKEGAVITLEKIKEHLKASSDLLGEKKVLTLIDGSAQFTMAEEANEYLASKEGAKNRIAAAFVTNSYLNRVWINLYVQFNKPLTPTKMFMSEAKAIAWLKSFYVMPGDKFERKKK